MRRWPGRAAQWLTVALFDLLAWLLNRLPADPYDLY